MTDHKKVSFFFVPRESIREKEKERKNLSDHLLLLSFEPTSSSGFLTFPKWCFQSHSKTKFKMLDQIRIIVITSSASALLLSRIPFHRYKINMGGSV